MARFVLDEDVQKSLAERLREAGHEVRRVQEEGLRGAPDEEVFKFAQDIGAALVTLDLGLADIRMLTETHHGVILVRMPEEMSTESMDREIMASLERVDVESLNDTLVVIEPGNVRERRTSL